MTPDLVVDWKNHSLRDAAQIAQAVCGPFEMQFLSPKQELAFSSYAVGRCLFAHVEGAPTALVPSSGEASREGDDNIKVFLFGITALWHQGDVSELIEAGSLLVHHRVGPYTLASPSTTSQIVVHIPERILPPRLGALLRRPQIFRPDVPGLSRILSAFLRSALKEVSSLDGTERACLASNLTQLVADMLSGREGNARPDNGMDLLLRRIKAYVAAHLTDSTLRISTIAQQMGCSERYLYKAFEGQAESLERYILNARLDRARSRLLAAANDQLSIRDVAESSGFGAYAHFSRAFKARFGVSPQECIPGRGRCLAAKRH